MFPSAPDAPRRVAIVTPFLAGTARGNATQANRKSQLLEDAGWLVSLIGISDSTDEQGRRASLHDALVVNGNGRPYVVIAIHAWHSRDVASVCTAERIPLVIATGGTDVSPGLDDPAMREAICKAFGAASRILAQSAFQHSEIARH